jgi:SOS response regulatory protein OraA/RecX
MFVGENVTSKEFELLDCDNHLIAAFDTISEALAYPRSAWLGPYRLRRSRNIAEKRHKEAMHWHRKHKVLAWLLANGYSTSEAETAAEITAHNNS